MKVRIEIFEDDGTEKGTFQFIDVNWKERVMNFINLIEDTKSPSTVPSSEIPVQQPVSQVQQQQQQQQQSLEQPLHQPQIIPNPQLQYYPNPPIQQPVYYYTQQPVQFQTQQPPQIHTHPLQQAAFPTTQPLQPQQYAAQPAPLQTQAHQPQVPLRDKINDTTLTISERLELFLKYEYPHVWFTSQEIQGHYERVYGFIKLSTVSTYLSRMYRKNTLQRRGNRTQREYMYICDEPEMVHADAMVGSNSSRIMQ